MSLLMEALKKAEEAKRQADGGNASAAPVTASIAEPTLTPPIGSPATNPSVNPLPNLSQHLDAVDADLAAVSTAPPPRRPSPADEQAEERSAARNVFAAKQQPGTGNTLWLIAGAGLLAVLGIGGYFWWQLQSIQSPSAGRPLSAPPAAVIPASAAPSVLPSAPALAGGSGAVRPTPEALPPLPSTGKSALSARDPAASQPPAHTPRASASTSVGPHREQADDAALRLTRTTPRTNTALERAYGALQTGRNDEAQHEYEQVLRADAKNTDALLGLATLAARQGQIDKAHAYYLHALETDPGDATARAGVLSTARQGDADSAESRLKTALSGQPDSPPLLFALGNLYARQQRWSEAQQAYFQAYAGEPDNPDIIFNLAVSLDRLRQGRLAAQYYRMALDAGDVRTAAFDRDQIRTRLLELQP